MYLLNNGEKVYFDNADLLCVSNFGFIYRDGNLTIKKYNDEDLSDYALRITEDIFNEVKDVDSKALLHLRDCYSDLLNIYDDYDYNEVGVTGYTYDFIEEDSEPMIDKPMYYTLNSIHELDLLVKEFNKRRILLEDPKAGNSIVTKDNLVIIDPDLFELNQSDIELRNNYLVANRYIAYKWAREYSIIDEGEFNALKNMLCRYSDSDFNTDYYGSMKRRLLKYKTPREYLYHHFGERI